MVSQQRYMPFGVERLDPDILQTDYGFTGQRDLAAAGLMDYNARWYGTNFARFVQPDTKLAGSSQSQALNHYSYAANNPLRFVDSGGACPEPTNWQADTAYIVCVDLFISTERIVYWSGDGDGRGFESIRTRTIHALTYITR